MNDNQWEKKLGMPIERFGTRTSIVPTMVVPKVGLGVDDG